MAYTNAIYFLDYDLGVDTARADLVPSAYANNGAGLVRVTVGGLGTPNIVTGAVVTIAGTTGSLYAGDWKVTVIDANNIDLQGSTYSSNPAAKGTCVPFGGDSWANAWKTITAGATAARIAPGDIVRIAKSPAPVSLGANQGTWANGPHAATQSLTSATNASPIVVTKVAHGYVNGDIVYITSGTGMTSANGLWVVTNKTADTFELYDGWGVASSGNSATLSSATARKVNARAVVLDSAVTLLVDKCEGTPAPWTAANSAAQSAVAAGSNKAGNYAQKITAPASPATDTLYAYKAMAATNFSSCQKLTFWILNEVAILANQWELHLCSDNAGATPVDTFAIPAIASVGRWIPLTIARTGGGNLAASIQSVALWSSDNATVPTASKYVQLDNIQAATTAGLNLQSLISKNAAEQGGTEGWYPIQGIMGKVVMLDGDQQSAPNATDHTGYYGASEKVTTYFRETIKTTQAASSSTVVQEIQDSGTLALGNIQFLGGYNTSGANTCDGETYFDGLNGWGYGLYLSTKSYTTLNYLNFCRYGTGVYYDNTSSNNTITTLSNANGNTSSDVYYYASNNNTITTLSNANGNASFGVYYYASNNNTITTLSNANGNASYGVFYDDISSNNTIMTLSTAGNGTGGIRNGNGINYIRSALIAETTEVGGQVTLTNSRIYSRNHDQTAGNHWIFTDGGTMNLQAATVYTAGGSAWKLDPGSTRLSNYPLKLKIAEIAVNANAAVTVKAYVKLSHASQIAAKLVAPAGYLTGYTEQTAAKTGDTNWEELTITFTPSESGVVPIELWAWYVSGVQSAYVDTLTITQA